MKFRLPFISRERHEEAMSLLERHCALLQGRLDDAEAANDRLTDLLLYRQTGARVYNRPTPDPTETPSQPKSELEQAAHIAGSRLPSKMARAMTLLRTAQGPKNQKVRSDFAADIQAGKSDAAVSQ